MLRRLQPGLPQPFVTVAAACRCSAATRGLPLLLRRPLSSSSSSDPYRVLNIQRGCSDKELKKAFRAAAKRWHPDTAKGNAKKFGQVSEAYEAALAQRAGRAAPSGGGAQQSAAWHRQQRQYQRQYQESQQRQQHRQQHQRQWQEYGPRGPSAEQWKRRLREDQERANKFIERIKGSVLGSAVLLCVLFSGTPSARDDIFSPIRRLVGTQRDPIPQDDNAAGVLEMAVGCPSSGLQGPEHGHGRRNAHSGYPAAWMAQAVRDESQKYVVDAVYFVYTCRRLIDLSLVAGTPRTSVLVCVREA